MSNDADDSSMAIQRIAEIRRMYQERKHEAVADEDEIGAAYLSGKLSGLIAAEETLKDVEGDGGE